MKKILFLVVLNFIFSLSIFAQNEYVSGSLKYGTLSNSVMLTMKSNTTFTGNFSNVQFMVQVPNTVSPQPTATILNNPLSTALNGATFQTQVTNENGFYNYLFSAIAIGAPSFTFNAGVEYNALEVKFSDGPAGLFSDVRLGHLPDGGSTAQLAFYIELVGSDYTNYTSMFYGTGASNGGSYSSYSYVPLSNVLLPVQFTAFTVSKSKNDALLQWSVENQSPITATYQIERSLNGSEFNAIAQLPAKTTENKGNYTYNDVNAGLLKDDGLVYYRIKQTDLDGKYTYSNVRSIRIMRNPLQLTAFPNPVKDITRLRFETNNPNAVRINVYDAQGKIVHAQSHIPRMGQNQLSLGMSHLISGTYLITITDGQQSSSISVTKQ
jgi:hypothetical protein